MPLPHVEQAKDPFDVVLVLNIFRAEPGWKICCQPPEPQSYKQTRTAYSRSLDVNLLGPKAHRHGVGGAVLEGSLDKNGS